MKLYKDLNVANLQHNCNIWKKTKGFVGEFGVCSKTLKLDKLTPVWQVKVPEDTPRCWSTVKKDEDPRCHIPVPGFGHPHVVMINDYFYLLEIDLL